ncbi:MAG: hypothetical protein H0T11_02380 [Chthoniobacterales bacterium]|nr:hypothetical protein [Chthoniobacterales bacterium]
MHKTTIRKSLYLGSLLAAFLSVGLVLLNSNSTQKNQSGGNLIIGALENYKSDHRAYPPSLDALMPKYLKKLPKVYGGATWKYSTFSNDQQFRIAFFDDSPRSITGNYRSDQPGWVLID